MVRNSQGLRRTVLTLSALLPMLLQNSVHGASSAPTLADTPRDLEARIRAVLNSGCLELAKTGVQVVALKDGSEIFSKNPDIPLKPASNQKLFTSAAALALLKPDYVFPTIFYSTQPVRQGILDGDLYIKGFGAPDLVGEFWWLMVQELSRQGLREIRGDLVADDTYFDPVERPLVWPRTVPEDSYFRVNNRSVTTSARGGLVVGRGFQQGMNTINVSGSIRLGSAPTEVTKGVEEPALYALAAFQELAARQGIVVRGKPRRAAIPEDAVELFRFESKPLAAIVRDMNKNSNNFIAETLLKTLGAQFVGIPGSTAKGLEVLREYLTRIGVSAEGIALADGSGLSHENRVTARALVQTLKAMNEDFELWPEFLASLPIAGVDGTLQRRFRNEDLLRKVRAKTGKISGVTSLSGYAVNERDETFAFAILMNDYRCGTETIKRLMDRVCSALVESDFRVSSGESKPSSGGGAPAH